MPYDCSGCQGYPAAALKLHYKDAELISISPLPFGGQAQRMFVQVEYGKDKMALTWKDGNNEKGV